jgi:hypothetical protein
VDLRGVGPQCVDGVKNSRQGFIIDHDTFQGLVGGRLGLCGYQCDRLAEVSHPVAHQNLVNGLVAFVPGVTSAPGKPRDVFILRDVVGRENADDAWNGQGRRFIDSANAG